MGVLSASVARLNAACAGRRAAGCPHGPHRRLSTAGGRAAASGRDKARAAKEDRELYLSVLSSSSTKREARSYLQRFRPSLAAEIPSPNPSLAPPSAARTPLTPPPAILRYLRQSSFTQADIKARNQTYVQRLLQNHPPPALAQLPPSSLSFFIPEITEEDIHVGLVKIRDVSSIDPTTLLGIGRTLSQLNRLGLFSAVVIDEAPPSQDSPEALRAWRAFVQLQADRVVAAIEQERGQARRVDGCVTVAGASAPEITLPNLLITPLSRGVIPVLAPIAFNETQAAVPTTADGLVLALTTLLSASCPAGQPVEQPVALDRIIFLDPLGGTPSHDRPSGAHVFINLEQEYSALRDSLLHTRLSAPQHLSNLRTLRAALRLLPPTSSAIITTPALAAATAAQTAAAKNPLIHNLLTDKPVISSSLPVLPHSRGTLTTLLKHGIPLATHRGVRLTDPAIDLPKLVALVEDSFGKALDVEHYLRRVDAHMAALIVAGDYEGAAIVTWEYPHGGGSAADRVCYLDKFAVLKRSQGTGGVADVVFKSMVDGVRQGLFGAAEGIVWRSRRWNPVNKWYFERAKGTYKIPDSGWTMFWTTQDAELSKERFTDYAKVCKAIEPSLKDE